MKFIKIMSKSIRSAEMLESYVNIEQVVSVSAASSEKKEQWPVIKSVIGLIGDTAIYTDSTPEEVLAKIAAAEKGQ